MNREHYEITFARSALKELENLDKGIVNRIFSKIEALSENPRPSDCQKIRGFREFVAYSCWRLSRYIQNI